jgi:excisionase family DNA binding protein
VIAPNGLKHGGSSCLSSDLSLYTRTPQILAQRRSQRAVLRPSAPPSSAPSPRLPLRRIDPVRASQAQKGPNVSTPLPALLTITRAATILGLSRATAYRYAAAGELPTKRLGGRMYVITAKIRPLIDGTEERAA